MILDYIIYSNATDIEITCRSSGGLTDLCHWTRSLTFRVDADHKKTLEISWGIESAGTGRSGCRPGALAGRPGNAGSLFHACGVSNRSPRVSQWPWQLLL